MELNKYQEMAEETAIYPMDKQVIYPALGLAGEAGEAVDKVKKVIRDKMCDFTDWETRKEIALELGDVLWYVAILARDLGYPLELVAKLNLAKLKSRKARGKIHGQGDNR